MWLSTELLRLKTNSLDLVITKTYRKTISFSSGHSFFDPNIPLLLYIEMLLCSQTLRQLIDQIKNSLIDKNYRIISFFISYELMLETLEGVSYLHKHNVIHRNPQTSKYYHN
jgi:serine/threonine protein kinase